jgi:hypothetical protein
VKATTFWRIVVSDESDFLERIVAFLRNSGLRFCVIGGQAVNAYADPVVSLGLDIVNALDEVDRAEELLRREFRVERFPHSLNVAAAGSDSRVQIQTDPRYGEFLQRATERDVFGVTLPVADPGDLLQGKIWASDPTRRGSKRLKDLADIARLVEASPELSARVPEEIRQKLA